MSKKELDNAAVVKTACILLVGILILGYASHKDSDEKTSVVTQPAQRTSDATVMHKAARPALQIDDRIAITKPYFACASQDDLDRVKQLAMIENDAKAAAVYGLAHGCDVQKEGAVFSIEHMSIWHGSICIRMTGEPECAWFPEQLVTKVE